MYEFRDGHKKTSEIFDVEKMSKFLALIDLTGHHHASHPHNLKFYFNPVTSLIEPVGYDNSSLLPLENQGLLGNVKNVKAPIRNRGEVQWKNDPLSEQLFNDSIFFNSYMHYLTEYSNKEWLTSFFSKYNESAQEQLQTIWRSYPEYDFLGKEILFHNQEIIRNNLELCIEPVIKDDLIVNENGEAELKFRNPNSLPLELLSVKVNSKVYTLENLFLESSYNRERQQFTSISIEEVFEDTVNVQLEYKIFGVDRVHIFDYECTTENRISTDVSKVPALNNFSDLSSLKALVIEDGNIDFTKGEYLFDSDIIIPSGYVVKLNPGVRINLVNGAKFISQSPFIAEGLENDSIHFYSTDKTGEGIFILKTAEQSKFEYCRFSGLSNLIDAPWKLSGAVNFYNAEVLMNHCLLSSNLRGDDMLNIMNSNFEINNCVFIKVLADAFDGDFAIGKIVNCEFEMIGNDAMDFSGSNITIESCRISDVEDKALSAGEKSVVDIKSLVIRNSAIAITAKDKSMIKGENITISGADIGISAFQKKSQFGSGTIELAGCKFSQVKIENMIEEGSLLLLNGIEIKGEYADVEDLLYGSVYGKITIK